MTHRRVEMLPIRKFNIQDKLTGLYLLTSRSIWQIVTTFKWQNPVRKLKYWLWSRSDVIGGHLPPLLPLSYTLRIIVCSYRVSTSILILEPRITEEAVTEAAHQLSRSVVKRICMTYQPAIPPDETGRLYKDMLDLLPNLWFMWHKEPVKVLHTSQDKSQVYRGVTEWRNHFLSNSFSFCHTTCIAPNRIVTAPIQ